MDEIIISVFYDIDNFCKELKKYFEHSLISENEKVASFEPLSALSLSEVMTICVLFHLSGYRTLSSMIQNLSKRNTINSSPSLLAITVL